MDANLTRYEYRVTHDACGTYARMEECDDGEFVKFADVVESLSTSHNKPSAEIAALADQAFVQLQCGYYNSLVITISKLRAATSHVG
jgi:hypothetical protein